MNPPRAIVAFWGVVMGVVAITLLVAGGLQTLQQAAIVVGAPFALLLIGLCVSLIKALRAEPLPEPEPRAVVRLPEPAPPSAAPPPGAASGS